MSLADTGRRARRRQQCVATHRPSPPQESALQLWDITTGKEIRHIGLGKTRINQAVVSRDRNSVAIATDQTLRLWDLATGPEIRSFGRVRPPQATSRSHPTARSWRARKQPAPLCRLPG